MTFPTDNIFPAARGVRAEVRFGMASRNCSGLGICSVEATARTPEMSGGCGSAVAYLTYERFGQISLHFLKATVCLMAEKKHFRRGRFVVREVFELPLEFTKGNTLGNKLVPPGKYPVVETEQYWVVTFYPKENNKNSD